MSGSDAFGHDIRFTVEAIWKVLLASLVLGAGLPAVFALGIRSLAWGTGGDAEVATGGTAGTSGTRRAGNPAGTALAIVLFVLVVYCVAAAIVYIIASGKGQDISFAHVIPTMKAKS